MANMKDVDILGNRAYQDGEILAEWIGNRLQYNADKIGGGGSGGETITPTLELKQNSDNDPIINLTYEVSGEVMNSPVSFDKDDFVLQNNHMKVKELSKLKQDVVDINESLTNEANETFNYGIKDGVRGFFTDPSRADDSFIPFRSKPLYFNAMHISQSSFWDTAYMLGSDTQIISNIGRPSNLSISNSDGATLTVTIEHTSTQSTATVKATKGTYLINNNEVPSIVTIDSEQTILNGVIFKNLHSVAVVKIG